MNSLKKYWLDLNSSLWFLPGLIVAGSVALALGLVEIDKQIVSQKWLLGYPRLFGVEPAGSRDMLGAVAGSMITIAGIVFSIVIVALSLASTQYTPRILRNFMRDQINQVVLGVFVGIFTYCIVVLRTIRGGDDKTVFVPSISVVVGVLLALVGIGFLIYFIHHIAVSIQASSIVANITDETIEVIDELFPHRLGEDAPHDEIKNLRVFESQVEWQTIPAITSGYIQNIDIQKLLDLTGNSRSIIKMEHGVGEFVVAGTPLAAVTNADKTSLDITFSEELTRAINGVFSIDDFRTIDQDAAFGIRQIVDIVMKALSPGINDTTTAVICIDYLTVIISHLAVHPFPSCYRFSANRLHVITKSPDFEYLIDLAFDQPRQNAKDNVSVILRLFHALEQIVKAIRAGRDLHRQPLDLMTEDRIARLEAVMRHLRAIYNTAQQNISSVEDLTQIEKHFHTTLKNLGWEELFFE